MTAACTRVRVGGIDVSTITETGLADRMAAGWRTGQGGWIVTANVDIVRAASRDPELAALVAKAEVVVADGMPVVWAGRLAGGAIGERVTGASLVFTLSARAAAEDRSVYLLGGDEGVPEAAGRVLMERYEGLRVAGAYSPPYGFDTDPGQVRDVVERVVAVRPDLVLVGLGFPKQERMIVELRPHLPQAWYLGCGAGIPMAAGQFSRAPALLQRSGGEWLHRLALEPRRLARRYLLHDAPYALRLLAQALRIRLQER
ncbi:N-acetylglucosaminyldiphosphoundecaprenol N-acetyl-beta-D-mannosaminyltransferase [Nonomuraea polychroma]|uniref:N-acetylglucosaminyldiphosphoundecaprenol N-acetyl-beta-D-mannosaminyltransferase n=1 Tax=Nonomuraea polychroma TaxID=46176 RepID=A0A438MLM3_9ACTN|nr:WecB/TagA/CpsF family glycosyltransferase [Nonomuraea polychroma]RVX46658.1 N-acetylglucosaminyldiphosphoundecaprenol N-acetyl-beta-D-mannosaminyltransferase [Nonomuraea polychroma]